MVLTILSDSMNAEAMERIFNAAGGAVKEHRLASWSNRMDRLLGVAGNPNFILSEMPDANELNEEDVWGEDLQDMASFSLQESLLDAFRPLTSSRRTVATEKDLGLSTALGGEIGKGREIYPLSLLNESDETRPASRLSSSSRMISQRAWGGYSRMYMIPHSAPVNVPGWSKMSDAMEMRAGDDDNGGDSDDDAERLPPHEFFARRADISSFSVLEGAGRTLKGRDLSRVRSAVYRQTGFDE